MVGQEGRPAFAARSLIHAQRGKTARIELLLISDTHLPKRARDLPDEVWQAVEHADITVHAGDWVEVGLLDRLEAHAQKLIGVWGNNDGGDLRERLPEVAHQTVAGVRLAVVHETGGKQGREIRCDQNFAGADVVVFGHSHIPWDTVTPNGIRMLNPGSPTDRRRQPYCTYMTLTLIEGRVSNVHVHEIPR